MPLFPDDGYLGTRLVIFSAKWWHPLTVRWGGGLVVDAISELGGILGPAVGSFGGFELQGSDITHCASCLTVVCICL